MLSKRRLQHRIDTLRGQANTLYHERDVLRPELLQAKEDRNLDSVAELSDRLREIDKQLSALNAEIRATMDKRYSNEPQHAA